MILMPPQKHDKKSLDQAVAYLRNRKPQSPFEALLKEIDHLCEDKSIECELRQPFKVPLWERQSVRRGGFGLVLFFTIGLFWLSMPTTYRTDIGQQRSFDLSDGSQITLNTDSEVGVRMHGLTRSVTLRRGEAYFKVAHLGSQIPFIVKTGQTYVRVTGTEFDIERQGKSVSIDVIKGHVYAGSGANKKDASLSNSRVSLTAGQAAAFDISGHLKMKMSARQKRISNWKQGRVYFDQTPLGDAIVEMNRYSRKKIILESPELARYKVDGIFDGGSSQGFAEAVGLVYPVTIKTESSQIRLSKKRLSCKPIESDVNCL